MFKRLGRGSRSDVYCRVTARCGGGRKHMAPLRHSCALPPTEPNSVRAFSTSPAFRTLPSSSPVRMIEMRAGNELLYGYRELVRARLQELMIREGYLPSHPLVNATSLHLNLSTASEVAANYGAPTNAASYYQGCDIFYHVPQRPASPLSDYEDSSFISDIKQTV